jgi:branched-chain amino acid transport system substrate-binding protein
MANFTVGIKHAAELALDAMNKDGGILVNELGKKLPVEIIWGDSESSPTKASEVATKLATSDKVDILVGEWTPDTANPVSVVGERYQIPTLVSGAPDTSWLANGPYEWSFARMFNYDFFLDEYFNGFDRLDTNKKDRPRARQQRRRYRHGRVYRAAKAPERGYTVVDPGRFPQARRTTPPSLIKFKAKTCDILVASLIRRSS